MFRDSRRVRQLLGLMILTSITLITIDYRAGANSPFRGLRRSAGTLFGPIERGVSSALRPVGNALSTLSNVGSVDKEVKKLRAERSAVQGQQRTNDDKDRQYQEAQKLLKFVDLGQYRTIPAHVVAAAPSNFSWTVTVDAGSNRGVRTDLTVLNSDGLVGKVIEVSKFTSTVLLAIDVKSSVAARLAYTGEQGLVSGNGPKQLTFKVTPATAEVRTGQPVLTVGSTFQPGVPIGKVVSSRAAPGAPFRTVSLEPYVNFSNLDLVAIVVQKERKTDPDVLVPANPKPSSSPQIPPCPASVAPGAPSTASSGATSSGALSSPPASPAAPAGPAPSMVPCLSSMTAPTATPSTVPSPAPSP